MDENRGTEPSTTSHAIPSQQLLLTGRNERKSPTVMGVTHPKALYAPPPQPPHNISMPQPVTVELLINPDGSVARTSLQGHPNPQLAQSVLDAVGKWKFEPARLLGVPIARSVILNVEFKSK